jgi:uridine phosphorylase
MGNFGFGAPSVVVILEELIAFGMKQFISIGTAGTLQKKLKIGDLFVCEKAIRDEGTSYHYLKPSKYAYASKELTDRIKLVLDTRRQKYYSGTSWTIDAPYRETIAEVKQYQAEGVATVEMEASALFAVAEYRGVQMGAILTVSDSVADLKWSPEFRSKKTSDSLEILCQVAIASLNR